MLQNIRDKITGWVAGVIIIVIGIVFVFWGVDFQSSAGGYAAKVNGTAIPLQAVRNAWQQRQTELQQILRDDLPADLVRAQQQMVLERFIQETLLTQRARDQGYRVSDAVLAQRVMEIPQFQVDGQFSQDRYIALLRSNGINEAAFEADLQAGLMLEQLQQGVADSAFITAGELRRRFQLEQQQREVNYVLLPTSAYLADVVLTEEQIEQFYQDHSNEYLSQESVDLEYIELTRAQAEGTIQVTEEGLRDYFERVKDRFQSEERRQARHILITTETLDDAAAEKKAQELAEQARGGADFAQLATENSQDPGSAAQGGDLGWAQRGMFVGPFEEALFAMSAGEIRGPVKTQFGYHVLKLEAVESGHAPDFEQARAEVEAEYRAEQAQTIFYDRSQSMAERAFSALTELAPVAEELGLELKTVKGFTREGGGEFGGEREVIAAAFSPDVLERRQNSPLVAVGEDKAVVLRVTDHRPAAPLTLAEVRDQITTRMRLQAARDAAQARGEQIIARLQAGEAWDALTADGVEFVGTRLVTRQDGIAPPAVLREAFSVDQSNLGNGKVHVAGVNTDDGNFAVLSVSAVINGDSAKEDPQELQARKRRAEVQAGGGEFNAYVAEAQRTAKVVRNASVFEVP